MSFVLATLKELAITLPVNIIWRKSVISSKDLYEWTLMTHCKVYITSAFTTVLMIANSRVLFLTSLWVSAAASLGFSLLPACFFAEFINVLFSFHVFNYYRCSRYWQKYCSIANSLPSTFLFLIFIQSVFQRKTSDLLF